MDQVYLITGRIIIWGLIGCICGAILTLASLWVWYKTERLRNKLTHYYYYYVIRKKIPTEALRQAYAMGYNKLNRHIAKYRLRNIKRFKTK